jgi:hypothetical protein
MQRLLRIERRRRVRMPCQTGTAASERRGEDGFLFPFLFPATDADGVITEVGSGHQVFRRMGYSDKGQCSWRECGEYYCGSLPP